MSPEDSTQAPEGTTRQLLSRATEGFRSTLATTIDQVRAMLPTADTDDGCESDHAALGDFANGRINQARFASLVVRKRAVDPATSGVIGRALATLSGLAEQGEALTEVNVPPGESLHGVVSATLARVGTAFGAARVIALVRSGCYVPAQHDRDLESLPFARWNRLERRLAPPLLIELDGADLHAGALDEFLDGTMRFVFVLRGEASAAPLARLVSPDTFVMQTTDVEELSRLFDWDGPGLAAVVPEACARFEHDPAGGAEPWERITLSFVPTEKPVAPVRGISVIQQVEQLRLLTALASKPAVPPSADPPAPLPKPPTNSAVAAEPDPAPDPAEKLAAWLLASADLSDLP